MGTKIKRIYSVDYVKYICALVVVFLHVVNTATFAEGSMGGDFRKVIYTIGGFISPVEVFFVFSAYLFFKKSPDIRALGRFVTRLYTLSLIYAILYIPYFAETLQGRSVINSIFSMVNQLFISGYCWHGWFVPALAFGMVLAWVLVEFMRRGGCWRKIVVYLLIACTAVISLLGSSYCNSIDCIDNGSSLFRIATLRIASLCRAPIYLWCGYFLASCSNGKSSQDRVMLTKSRPYVFVILYVCFEGLRLMENYFINKYGLSLTRDISIGRIFSVFFFCALVLSLNNSTAFQKKHIANNSHKWCGASTVMYFSHMSFSFALSAVTPDLNPYVKWGVIVLLTTGIGFLLDDLLFRYKIKWMKYVL